MNRREGDEFRILKQQLDRTFLQIPAHFAELEKQRLLQQQAAEALERRERLFLERMGREHQTTQEFSRQTRLHEMVREGAQYLAEGFRL